MFYGFEMNTQPLALCVESLVVADADPEILIWNAVARERLGHNQINVVCNNITPFFRRV